MKTQNTPEELRKLSEEAAAVVAKIQTSRRPVVLFDLCADMYEVTTAANADGLHRWQRLTATGLYSQGCDTLHDIAQMIVQE